MVNNVENGRLSDTTEQLMQNNNIAGINRSNKDKIENEIVKPSGGFLDLIGPGGDHD
jgi:hypothetical protein